LHRNGLGQVEKVVGSVQTLDRECESGSEMTRVRTGAIGIICGIFGTSMLDAGDLSSYRGLPLGMSLTAAAKEAGTTPAEAMIVHQRPALIQEMEWRPRPPVLADPVKADPVRGGLLCFFNGELFRIVVTYDRYQVAGMTAEDMIEGISATYGSATRPVTEIAFHSNYGEVAAVIARWEDAEYSYDLVRTGDRSSFAMVLYSKRLDALAQAAIVEAVRLEAREAPQRELEKLKKRDEEERLALEKARSENKANFRP
jgi:hypothetical protein